MNTINKNPNSLPIFIIFLIISFLFFILDHNKYVYFLSWLFKPIEVFLHENSHLVMTLLTGGSVEAFNLRVDHGHVISRNHYLGNLISSFSGYAGASFLGCLIYLSSFLANKYIKGFILAFCFIPLIFIDGIITLFFTLYVITVFYLCWKLEKIGQYLLRFIGVYVMTAAIYSPTYLLAYSDTGDHVNLSSLTLLPSFLFIFLWLFISLFFLYFSFKFSLKYNKNT